MSPAATPSSVRRLMALKAPAHTSTVSPSSTCAGSGKLRRAMSFCKRIEIRWRDLDGFGHVNNSTYLTYLEEGRDEYLTGLLGEAVHRVVVGRVEIDFRSGLVYEDEHVDVHMRLLEVGRSSARLEERIESVADGRLAAEAKT